MKKIATTRYLVMFILTFIFLFILDNVFGLENSFYRIVIAAPLAILLSPRVRKVKKQQGAEKQITWIFLKQPITLEK